LPLIIYKYNKQNSIIAKFLCILIPLCFVVGNAALNLLSFIFFVFFLLNLFIDKNYKFLKQKYFCLLSVCYLFIIISLFFSEYSSKIFFKSIILFKIFVLPICFQYFFLKFSTRLLLFYSCFLVVLFVSFDAWIQYLFGVNLFGSKILDLNDISRRISGVFFD